MKRIYILFYVLLVGIGLFAQDNDSRLQVRKLELIYNDTEASRAQKKDPNGDKCALIKIQTPNMDESDRNKLEFSADLGTFVYSENATGEVKLFLTEHCKTLIIKHPDYGVLTYRMPISVEGFKTYKMVLEADKSIVAPKVTFNSNYVNIKVVPSDATITVDGVYCSNGKANISIGEPHELVVSHEFYHTYEKDIYSSADEKLTYEVNLVPAFGWLYIESEPENGATILINGKKKGTTPFRSDTLASGEYEVTLLKEMFETTVKTVVVRDNNVGEIAIPMKPLFAEVNVSTDLKSDIYVDGEKVGTGSWKGRLNEGDHVFEAKKTSHRSTNKSVYILIGKAENITLDAPIPIYGAIDVQSNPDEAVVYLDGEKIGETPFKQNNVLIGAHTLRFEKKNYDNLTKTIEVKEGEILSVNEKLVAKYVPKPKTEPKKEVAVQKPVEKKSEKVKPQKKVNASKSDGMMFYTLNAAYSVAPQWSFGLTVGNVKNVGWFATVMTNFNFKSANLECDGNGLITEGVNSYYPVYTKSSTSRFSIMGGLVFSLGKTSALRAGLGYGFRNKFWETQDGNLVKSMGESFKGLDYTAGIQFNFRGFVLSVDAVTTQFKTLEFKLGIGLGVRK